MATRAAYTRAHERVDIAMKTRMWLDETVEGRHIQFEGFAETNDLSIGGTFLASPYGRFISGHTLVVDGANWQRRNLTNPPVVTVRDQMARGRFDP